MQNALSILYPGQCVSCNAFVESDHALCGPCWARTPFVEGLVCDACGVPLLGEAEDEHALCDDCLRAPPNWSRGRSALLYEDMARKLVMSLKHGGRLDLARPMGRWLAALVPGLLPEDGLIVPIPLHWTRLATRRFNQSAVLARHAGKEANREVKTDVLLRTRRTSSQEGKSREERHENLASTMAINPRRAPLLDGRSVLVVDDVMTSGATLAAATHALQEAGSGPVRMVTLARVVKDT